jgi:hypothetical protein
MFAERDFVIGGGYQSFDARQELAFESTHGRGAQRAPVDTFGARIGNKMESFDLAYDFAANDDAAGIIEHEIEGLIFTKPAHQDGRAPVDEALREAFMKCIR